MIDDSTTPLFIPSSNSGTAGGGGGTWRAERSTRAGWSKDDIDWLFFGHGHLEYKACLHDFVLIAGDIALMPAASYGVWWSRYWTYDEAGISEVVQGYKSRDIPLHMLVLVTKTSHPQTYQQDVLMDGGRQRAPASPPTHPSPRARVCAFPR